MFETKGAVAQWVPLFDLLSTKEIDDVVSYAEMSAVAGFSVLNNRGPLYDAIRHLESDCKRTAECIPNVGYRVVHPREHSSIGLKHQKKARRSVGRGLRKVGAADLSLMNQDELRTIRDTQAIMDSQHRMLRKRVDNHDVKIEALEAADRKKQVALDELRSNLARLGVTLPDSA